MRRLVALAVVWCYLLPPVPVVAHLPPELRKRQRPHRHYGCATTTGISKSTWTNGPRTAETFRTSSTSSITPGTATYGSTATPVSRSWNTCTRSGRKWGARTSNTDGRVPRRVHLHHRRRSLAAEPKELSKEMRTASKAAATKVARISKRRVPASGKRSSDLTSKRPLPSEGCLTRNCCGARIPPEGSDPRLSYGNGPPL